MEVKQRKPKVIVIVGPTASGKTGLAITIAEKHNGEVVSADSRQVYKKLDIGTEKVTKEEMRGIKHHLIDVADPKKPFTVEKFKILADAAIADIIARGKVPIIAGGTGFYIDAVIENIIVPKVPPNKKLREQLENKTKEELFLELQKKDKNRADTIDPDNKRYLVRALEIIDAIGTVPPIKKGVCKYRTLKIGILTDNEILKKRIRDRLAKTMTSGLIEETKKLHNDGLSFERLNELGLEYRLVSSYIRGEIDEEEMITKMENELWHYAKRQKTWFRRDEKIKWFSLEQREELEEEIQKFLNNGKLD